MRAGIKDSWQDYRANILWTAFAFWIFMTFVAAVVFSPLPGWLTLGLIVVAAVVWRYAEPGLPTRQMTFPAVLFYWLVSILIGGLTWPLTGFVLSALE